MSDLIEQAERSLNKPSSPYCQFCMDAKPVNLILELIAELERKDKVIDRAKSYAEDLKSPTVNRHEIAQHLVDILENRLEKT